MPTVNHIGQQLLARIEKVIGGFYDMSRAAVFNLLVEDPELNDLGLNGDTVFHNWSSEERPANTTAFAILRWEDEGKPIWGSEKERNARRLTLWVHWPKELTNDFNRVTAVLDRVDEVLGSARDVAGDDGYSLSFVDFGGRSADIVDEGFNTITRNASYENLFGQFKLRRTR